MDTRYIRRDVEMQSCLTVLLRLRICLSLWIKLRNDDLVHSNKCRAFALCSERFAHVTKPRHHDLRQVEKWYLVHGNMCQKSKRLRYVVKGLHMLKSRGIMTCAFDATIYEISMKYYFNIVSIGNEIGLVKFDCAVSSNFNVIEPIKFSKINFSQNIGISFSSFFMNLLVQFCMY